jgi:hypothetical protein
MLLSKHVKQPLNYRTPVFLLTDCYLANGSEPWSIPDFYDLPNIYPNFAVQNDALPFMPYARDEKTLAPPRAIPGPLAFPPPLRGLEKATCNWEPNQKS